MPKDQREDWEGREVVGFDDPVWRRPGCRELEGQAGGECDSEVQGNGQSEESSSITEAAPVLMQMMPEVAEQKGGQDQPPSHMEHLKGSPRETRVPLDLS